MIVFRWERLSPQDFKACAEIGDQCEAHYLCSSCGDVIHLGASVHSEGWGEPTGEELHALVLGDPPRCWDCRHA